MFEVTPSDASEVTPGDAGGVTPGKTQVSGFSVEWLIEAVRRRLETAGSTELQEGLLGRWVESARDKVHVVAKAGPHHHNRSTILEAEEDRK